MVIFKNCTLFIDCISKKKQKIHKYNTLDNAKGIDVVISMYNLIKYRDNYSKASGSVWQYYRDEPPSNNYRALVDFVDNTGVLFKFEEKVTGLIGNNGTKHVEIMVPLKYLSI